LDFGQNAHGDLFARFCADVQPDRRVQTLAKVG
jgi:hypothetical protein